MNRPPLALNSYFQMDNFQTERSPDFLYVLRSGPTYGWRTGQLGDGRQLLGDHCSFFFSPSGDFLSYSHTKRMTSPKRQSE